eukprot:TRINITY_DN94121_c0_g1_i1.p1 TRINITY_DN94121_c0_g1~~TRINITY_DN94121_c0_g1_i1.p1  ORF type:complete len:793 (+),score=119.73 TRINITY_DN94121_c0_g1_i1:53-2431(+)
MLTLRAPAPAMKADMTERILHSAPAVPASQGVYSHQVSQPSQRSSIGDVALLGATRRVKHSCTDSWPLVIGLAGLCFGRAVQRSRRSRYPVQRASGSSSEATEESLRAQLAALTAELEELKATKTMSAAWPLDPEDANTLRQVVVVHRHGTRFPTKPTGAGNLSWPQRAHFWSTYKGHLTPVGAKQLEEVGKCLRDRYIGADGGIFKGLRCLDGRAIAVYTSNIQRTLQSAWSFLTGFVPSASVFFAFRSERVFSDALRQAVGIPIYVEDAEGGDDKLFHEWTMQKGYKEWLQQNQERSEFLQYARDAPEYTALLDKLWHTTHEEKLHPDKEPLKRLVGAKDVDTLVTIDEAHNRPLLPNESGMPLLPEEKSLLRKIGNEVKRCWFGDSRGDKDNSYGKRGAAYLAHKIWRHMDERARHLCHLRFVQFSCHDTTMCALAAHLGLELSEIGFGAFFVFELHKSPTSGHTVKCYYNPFPADGPSSYSDLTSFKLPLGQHSCMKPVADCREGHVPLPAFAMHCRIPGQEELFESFAKLLGQADLRPTRENLEALVERGKHGWLSFEDWRDMYGEAFRAFDLDGDGLLCRSEMETGLLDWYGITGRTIDLIFNLVDRDPNIHGLTEMDVYLASVALVGIRGSISSKTAGAVLEPFQEDEDLVDIDSFDQLGTTKLMAASNVGDLQRVRALAARGANVNLCDDYGWTALRYAVRNRHADVVSELVKLKADVNYAGVSGWTPLMTAVSNNSPDIVRLLVENGADCLQKNADGQSACDAAAGYPAILKILEPAPVAHCT